MCNLFVKYKIFVFAVFVSSIFWSCSSISRISYGTLHFDKEARLPFLNDKILWDTGAEISVIKKEHINRIPHRRYSLFIPIIDAIGTMRFLRLYTAKEFNSVDGLTINNFRFAGIRNPPESLVDYGVGLIGMDVIRHANWLIDFNAGTIEVFPQSERFETDNKPQMILSYRRSRDPKVTLTIAGVEIRNVLIDSGAAGGINLRYSDIRRINREHPPAMDTLFVHRGGGLFSSRYKNIRGFAYNNMTINGIYFDDVRIFESRQRFIGFSFFRRFDKVFLDTKRQRFYFFKHEKPICF